MAFTNRAKGMSASSIKAQQEKAAAQLVEETTGKTRIELVVGPNILMILPSMNDTNPLPTRPLLMHYKPFHVCLRADPFEDADGNVVVDKRFRDCPRCQQGWDAYADRRNELTASMSGATDDMVKKLVQNDEKAQLYRSNLSSEQLLVQAVNLTPFFKVEKVKSAFRLAVDTSKLSLMDEFVAVMEGTSEGEGLPPDMLKAAQAGVSTMLVAKTWGNRIRAAIDKQYLELGEEDPLMNPSSNLLKVVLEPDGKEFAGRATNGWSVSFATSSELAGLKLSDRFLEASEQLAVDIWDIKEEDDTIAALSRAMKKAPSQEALLSFLQESGWTLGQTESYDPDVAPADREPPRPSLSKTERSPLADRKSAGSLLNRYNDNDSDD